MNHHHHKGIIVNHKKLGVAQASLRKRIKSVFLVYHNAAQDNSSPNVASKIIVITFPIIFNHVNQRIVIEQKMDSRSQPAMYV